MARTFNLSSRSATIPVERHRVTRLAGESELRLLQQPIPFSLEKAVDFWHGRDGGGGIYTNGEAFATAPSGPTVQWDQTG
jgi:hypothetical protein